MEISKANTKNNEILKSKRIINSRFNSNYKDDLLPLPWKIWPYEGKILIILISIWASLGLFILGVEPPPLNREPIE